MSNENQILSDFLKHTTKTSVLYTELLQSIDFNLKAWNDKVIDSDDFANAIEEIYIIHYSKTLV